MKLAIAVFSSILGTMLVLGVQTFGSYFDFWWWLR